MSTEYTEVYCRKSPSTDGVFCTNAQFLAEFACIRQAAKNKLKIVPRFWQQDCWKPTFVKEIRAANNLLKVYSFDAILSALNHYKCKWINTLFCKQLVPQILLEEERLKQKQEKIDSLVKLEQEKELQNPITQEPTTISQPFTNKKSKFADLD